MKLALKKFIYILNDITNMLLKKDQDDLADKYKKAKIWLVISSISLAISIAANIYLYLKIY